MDTLPPFIGGSVTLMQNLLHNIELGNSIVVSPSIKSSMNVNWGIDLSSKLEIRRINFDRLGNRIKYIPNVFSSVPPLLDIGSIVKKTELGTKMINAELIFTCWPSNPYPIGACYAARKLRLPIILYLHDLWYETQRDNLGKIIAKINEKRLFSFVSKLLVISTPTKDYLEEKFGLKNIEVLEHSVNSHIWNFNKLNVFNGKVKNIIMVGAVNKFNLDSVIAFSKVLSKFPNISLEIFTKQKLKHLNEDLGLNTNQISTCFVPRNQLHHKILESDALYLPLGFNTPVNKEVEVVIPTRLMDYLPSGRPIIAHGPPSCWMIKEAENRGWGFVINTLDHNQITKYFEKFISIPNYTDLTEKSLIEAKRRDNKQMSQKLKLILRDLL